MNGQVIEQLTVKARLALLTNAWRIKTHALKFYFMGASRKGASTLKLRYIMNIGVLSSISIVLMLFNFPLPPFPNFLQVDFSDVPALLAAMTMGPVAGILVELLKKYAGLVIIRKHNGGTSRAYCQFYDRCVIYHPSDFFFYSKLQRIKGLIIGLVAGTIVMAVGMSY